MGREVIGSVTSWEPGAETDWAYEMAQSFLAIALGDPPDGVKIGVTWQNHDLGSYPTLCVDYPEFGPEPWDFIRRAEDALSEFSDAIDWHRIRPSNFIPDDDEDDEA